MNWLSKSAIRCIERYQRKGGGEQLFLVECNFTPSCSEYAKESICRFGVCRGGILSIKRIFRCSNPDLITKIHDPVPVVPNKREEK